MKVDVLDARGGAMRVGHDSGSLTVDVDRHRGVAFLVRAEVEWEKGVRIATERNVPFGGKLAGPLEVASGLGGGNVSAEEREWECCSVLRY